MKKLLLILSFVFASSLFAGHVIDRANLLGDSASKLQSEISNLPVWIEAYNSVPNDDIKGYADKRVKELTNDKGFIIVVTTHPRSWRISMTPVGFVGGEATRLIGDTMASRFRQGDFYNAFKEASVNLTSLTTPREVETATVPAPVSEPARKPVVKQKSKQEDSSIGMVVAFSVVVALGALAIIYVVVREKEKKRRIREEEERRLWAIEDKKREEARQKRRAAELEETKKRQEAAKQELESKKRNVTDDVRVEAEKAWNSYPDQASRDRIIRKYSNSPYYYDSGVSTDPLMFYLFLMAVSPSNTAYTAPAPSPSYSTPSYSSTSNSSRRNDDDDSYRRRSSNDSYGSSSDWGSSFGGFSSSDSGGSGGSW